MNGWNWSLGNRNVRKERRLIRELIQESVMQRLNAGLMVDQLLKLSPDFWRGGGGEQVLNGLHARPLLCPEGLLRLCLKKAGVGHARVSGRSPKRKCPPSKRGTT